MDKYISDLLELIKAHPELPIVPMVDSEIVCDDGYARWMGTWGPASVTKYLVSKEHIFFFDDEDVEYVLIEVKGYDEFLSMTDKEARKPITPSPGWSASPWTSTRHELLLVRRDHCLYNAELEAWYITPGEVQNAEDICFCCDECKHYDGDFSKRNQWRPDCPRHKFPEKYLEMQRIVEQRRARAAETRRRNFQITKGGKP